jgi:hypothetical protein
MVGPPWHVVSFLKHKFKSINDLKAINEIYTLKTKNNLTS